MQRIIFQRVVNFCLPNPTFKFHHNVSNILDLNAYFSKPIFGWIHELNQVCWVLRKPMNRTKVFLTYKGPSRTRKAHFGGPKLLRLSCFRDFENHFLNNSRETHRKLHTSFIPRCQTQSRVKAKITISLKDYFHFSGSMHLTVSYSSDSIFW